MGLKLPDSPVARIAIFASLIVLTIIGGTALLLGERTEEQQVKARIEGFIGDFNARNSQKVMSHFAQMVRIQTDDMETIGNTEVARISEELWSQHPYLHVDIEWMEVAFNPEGDRARSTVAFHATMSDKMYPNVRISTRSKESGGEPIKLMFSLRKEDNQWHIGRVTTRLE